MALNIYDYDRWRLMISKIGCHRIIIRKEEEKKQQAHRHRNIQASETDEESWLPLRLVPGSFSGEIQKILSVVVSATDIPWSSQSSNVLLIGSGARGIETRAMQNSVKFHLNSSDLVVRDSSTKFIHNFRLALSFASSIRYDKILISRLASIRRFRSSYSSCIRHEIELTIFPRMKLK